MSAEAEKHSSKQQAGLVSVQSAMADPEWTQEEETRLARRIDFRCMVSAKRLRFLLSNMLHSLC